MAAKIEKRDTIFLAEIPELYDGRGWHGLGTPEKEFTAESLQKVLWHYSLQPAGIQLPDGSFHATGEFYAVSGDDNLPVGGAVGNRYNTPQNLELFELFRDALAGSQYSIVSAGTVGDRCEFFLDAKGPEIKSGSRDISPYVGLHRPFGGTGRLLVNGHGTIMQCGNTTALFRRESATDEKAISAKNTLNIAKKLPEIRTQIEKAHGVLGEWAVAMAEAENIPLEWEEAGQAYIGLLAATALNTRTANRVNRLLQLFKGGAGNRGENLADWFNGATDFYTHESAGSLESADTKEAFLEKQWYSSEFGSAGTFKSRLAGNLFKGRTIDTDYVPKLAERGRQLIDDAGREVLKVLAL